MPLYSDFLSCSKLCQHNPPRPSPSISPPMLIAKESARSLAIIHILGLLKNAARPLAEMIPIMSSLHLLLLFFLAVEVHCQQTVPYVSFMGQTLANHSYVNISQVGIDDSGSDSVQCHTDLNTCCTGAQGSHRGDWYFPNGTRLPFHDGGEIVEYRQPQRVYFRRINPTVMGPTGIYHCDISTVPVHSNGMRETVYVGLYTSDKGKKTMCNSLFYPSRSLSTMK